jgi:fructose-specific phosphotransferase system IIC component
MAKLATFYLGYEVSWLGGIVGFFWGFVDGFVAGFLVAWIYNTVRPKFRKYIEPERG